MTIVQAPDEGFRPIAVWSGRGDLNARPPAPKAVSGLPRKCPIFKYLRFNEMRVAC
jgi:hypothetical protein